MPDHSEHTDVSPTEKPMAPFRLEPGEVDIASTMGSTDRYPDVATHHTPTNIVDVKKQGNQFVFTCDNGVVLKITVLESGLLQFTYSHDGYFQPVFSYAIDPAFQPETITPVLSTQEFYYHIRTRKLNCQVRKDDLSVRITDLDGNLINEDATGFTAKTTILKGVSKVEIAKLALPGEKYLGLGDKSCDNNLKGRRFVNWNSDAFSYDEKRDPLYRTIPFYYGLHDQGAYGIFFDNSHKSYFDFDTEQQNTIRFWAESGEANYYFFYEDSLTEIAKAYTRLTGTPELPPMWALGFHQCRWSYYPESQVREITQNFRDKNIPCDAIYLDIDYMDGYRCFTWNHNHFPNPTKLLKDLQEDGFHTVVMIDPGIRMDENYHVYQDGVEKDMFCKRPNGRLMTGPVWPEHCAFPDYTSPAVREWWGKLYSDMYLQDAVSGFWNDMNEPAVFKVKSGTFPDDVFHDYEGQRSNHKRAHNIYGMQMARATYEGLKTLKPKKRPLVITRATYSGGQRFSSVWTGDNRSDWNHLRIANTQCLRLSISGFSHVGTDIGGFHGEPDGELMVRWLQLGIFHPLYRVHSMGTNVDGAALVENEDPREDAEQLWQEPWSYGEQYTIHARRAIEIRYQLLGYLYTAFRQYCLDGTPVLRPLIFDYPKTENPNRPEFIWGNDLLVCPVLEPMATSLEVALPEGNWFDLFSGKKYTGNQMLTLSVNLNTIPVFAKPGSVIPFYPVRQYTGKKITDHVTLKIFYSNGKYTSFLYEDRGEGYAHEAEGYSFKTFATESTADGFIISQNIEGIFSVDYKTYTVEIYGLPFDVQHVNVDGTTVEYKRQESQEVASIRLQVSEEFGEIELRS